MKIKIGSSTISESSPVFVIAELSANHVGCLETAEKTIRAIKDAGGNAVKIQTYTPDTMTLPCRNKYFRIKQGTIWDGKFLYDLYKEAYTPWEWHPRLKHCAEKLGLEFFSTPFDETAVDFLSKLKMPAYKIASFEITDLPLIERTAAVGKPMIMSTGIATLAEIKDAVSACRRSGNDDIILLKCTSAYPAPYSEMNLRTIPDMIKKFGCPVGLSDHTLGSAASVAAVALGAKVIEKHFILSRKLGGPDASFSMEPAEFAEMVDMIRKTEAALGGITYEIPRSVEKSRAFARSLFVSRDIKKGEIFTRKNVKSVRPAYGLAPKLIKKILGRKASRSIAAGTPLSSGMVSGL